jgi:hypothetical protein
MIRPSGQVAFIGATADQPSSTGTLKPRNCSHTSCTSRSIGQAFDPSRHQPLLRAGAEADLPQPRRK